MSVKTYLPLSLITSSVSASGAKIGPLGRAAGALQNLIARLVTGPLVHRGLHNQDALLENQMLLARDAGARVLASMLRAAYREFEPAESKYLELVYLAEGADLYTEGRPWAVHYGPRTLVLINRTTRVAIGPVTPRLAARLNAVSQTESI